MYNHTFEWSLKWEGSRDKVVWKINMPKRVGFLPTIISQDNKNKDGMKYLKTKRKIAKLIVSFPDIYKERLRNLLEEHKAELCNLSLTGSGWEQDLYKTLFLLVENHLHRPLVHIWSLISTLIPKSRRFYLTKWQQNCPRRTNEFLVYNFWFSPHTFPFPIRFNENYPRKLDYCKDI